MAQDRIAVATIDGESIWLDEIMAVAETLPLEYQQQGIAGIYDQLVDDVANSRLAAIAARSSGLDKDEDVASAMKTAADRVLAEAYITREVGKEINEEAIQAAYDTYVADTGSRETVTASHILVETEEEAKEKRKRRERKRKRERQRKRQRKREKEEEEEEEDGA